MRYVLGLCMFALAVPVFAGDSGNPDPALALAPQAWTGKHSDQLIASWGKPRKTKRHGKDGKVLVYRLRFFGEEIAGDTIISWSEAGIGPSPVHNLSPRQASPAGEPSDMIFAGGPKIVATQKVKFYVDRQGIIQRQEFAPRKWKKKKP